MSAASGWVHKEKLCTDTFATKYIITAYLKATLRKKNNE
jgi:hypothetical protein